MGLFLLVKLLRRDVMKEDVQTSRMHECVFCLPAFLKKICFLVFGGSDPTHKPEGVRQPSADCSQYTVYSSE